MGFVGRQSIRKQLRIPGRRGVATVRRDMDLWFCRLGSVGSNL